MADDTAVDRAGTRALGGAPPERPVGTSTSNVTIVRRAKDGSGERTFHIIGTAHVSKKSIDEVRSVIREVRPDTVCVELDQLRYEALTDDNRWRKLDIFDVLRQGKAVFMMVSLALNGFQRRLGERLGVRPGSELLAGVETAREIGAEVVLADRDVQATLRRTWANLGPFNKLKLGVALTAAVFDAHEIDEEQVEALKDREHISDMMSELARVMPEVKVPLIDERDEYLMSMIEDAPGTVVVAVVGAGHVEGMTKQVGKAVDRDALSKLPPRSRVAPLLRWVLQGVALGILIWGSYAYAGEERARLLLAWVLPSSLTTGLFTLVAGGKLLTVLAAMLAAPLVALHPHMRGGLVAGIVEARLRPPTEEDRNKLGREVTTLKAMRANPFSRILIVTLAAGAGSTLGALAGLGCLLAMV